MSLKERIKNIIPEPILNPIQKVHGRIVIYNRSRLEPKLIEKQPALHDLALSKIREESGRPINVVFFALMDSVWKYDLLYRLMEKDPRFNPTILVCPIVNYGRDNMLLNMDNCYNLFRSRGYNVIKSYDPLANTYVDVRALLKPDVIFYTNPYEGLIDDRYYIKNFTDILTCYTSYFFTNTIHYEMSDTLLHNLVWRRYVEHDLLLPEAKKYTRNHGRNCIRTGYSGFDNLIFHNIQSDPWKKTNSTGIKRIIWAPHHTITNYTSVIYSTFLDYYEFMFDLAQKHSQQIIIAFKPHPLLKNRLNMLWGPDKTEAYYSRWENLPNGMLNDGAYEDLFLTSDAIIHDSGSFIGEYLCTGKPAMFLSNGRAFSDQYNSIGQKCLDNYYIGKNKDDIHEFIQNVVNERDPLREKRINFVNKELISSNGKSASENIINDLVKELIRS